MKVRNLDGVYFRVERDGKWVNRCFTDLTMEERYAVCKERDYEWFKSLAFHLADTLRWIGNQLDINMRYDDEDGKAEDD